MNITDSGTMIFTLDIAAILSAIIWPVIVLIFLFIYRENIPDLFRWLGQHIKKVEFHGISVEMAEAKGFVTDWSNTASEHDLRNQSKAMAVGSSLMPNLVSQLKKEGTADYVIVNLDTGKKWLSSRIFIMTILYTQLKGISAIVFLEKSGEARKKFVGWAEPRKIIGAFSKRYSWFEKEYIDAYFKVSEKIIGNPNVKYMSFNICQDGHLSLKLMSPEYPYYSFQLMQVFLEGIQVPKLPTEKPYEYVLVDSDSDTYEHTRWIDAEKLEEILGNELIRSAVNMSDMKSKNSMERLREFLLLPDRFVAVTSENGRFEYLVDRNVLLEKVVKTFH